jgi:hypothetical protein
LGTSLQFKVRAQTGEISDGMLHWHSALELRMGVHNKNESDSVSKSRVTTQVPSIELRHRVFLPSFFEDDEALEQVRDEKRFDV